MSDPAANRIVGPIVEIAHAKINLTLHVLGRRSDGYHELESIVTFAAAGDQLTLIPTRSQTKGAAPSSSGARLEVSGPFASAIEGENLVTKALDRVETAAGRRLADHIHLEKTLPVAAGIGGGSADAAALLRALQTAHPELLLRVDWHAIAASLGADVPVCLSSSPAFMTGIGDELSPLALPQLSLLLANPMPPAPAGKTQQIFTALAAAPLFAAASASHPPPMPLDRDRLVELVRTIGNDLAVPALRLFPGIAELQSALASSHGCDAAFLSGAGPTVVGIFATPAAAAAAASSLATRHPRWWLCATDTRDDAARRT